jgi:hypothetical protein
MFAICRNKRETWDLNLTEPVSANYYPVNAGLGIRCVAEPAPDGQ